MRLTLSECFIPKTWYKKKFILFYIERTCFSKSAVHWMFVPDILNHKNKKNISRYLGQTLVLKKYCMHMWGKDWSLWHNGSHLRQLASPSLGCILRQSAIFAQIFFFFYDAVLTTCMCVMVMGQWGTVVQQKVQLSPNWRLVGSRLNSLHVGLLAALPVVG